MSRHKCDNCGRTYYGHKRYMCLTCKKNGIFINDVKNQRAVQYTKRICLYCDKELYATPVQKYHKECALEVRKKHWKKYDDKIRDYKNEVLDKNLKLFIEKSAEQDSIRKYIQHYEDRWKYSIDMSPFGIQRTTEKRMIDELKELLK